MNHQPQRFRILLVEDNDDQSELVKRCFESSNDRLELVWLSDGEAAIGWLTAVEAQASGD